MPRLTLLAHPAVRSALALELGRAIEYHDTIDSTQERARVLAATTALGGVVVADAQRAGPGRHGRVWHRAKGRGPAARWVVAPAPAAPAAAAVPAGVAIARALADMAVANASLKWPNDVQLEGRKVAGALAHGTSDAHGGVLVLGIGINVHQRSEDLPPELIDTSTSLAIAGRVVDRLALFARLSAELDRVTGPAAFAAALDEWRARTPMLGRAVRVMRPDGTTLAGTATTIDDEGALLVQTPSGIERVVTGEVALDG